MGKEQVAEKLFSDQLDRILSGQEIQLEEQTDDDLRTALEFAHKITTLRRNPSPIFTARLREKLVEKLETQESRQTGWLAKIISVQPIWQAAAGVIIVLIFAGILWITGIIDFRPSGIPNSPTSATTTAVTTTVPKTTTAAPTTTSTTTTAATASSTTTAKPTTTLPPSPVSIPKILVSGSTDKTNYATGETVIVDITMQNRGAEYLKIENFPPILSLMDTKTQQPVYTFPAGSGTANLPPNAQTSFRMIWNQQDSEGKTISPGNYYLELEDLNYQGQAVKLSLAQPVQFSVIGY